MGEFHSLAYNVRHKWRASTSLEYVKGTSVEIKQDSSDPQDIARPSSCQLLCEIAHLIVYVEV